MNAGGTAALGNGEEGIILENAANTKIGGNGGNIISGNAGHGILINGNSAGTSVQRNTVGLSLLGTADLGNTGSGVYVNSTGVTVGGAVVGEGNVISGNNSSGLVLDKTATVRRNVIGLNANSTAKIPNSSYGIYVRSSNNQVGGAGVGNVVGGNGQDGVFVESGENNLIQGNFIGTNSGLSANLGNGMFGVHILYGQKTAVGGPSTSQGNTIAFNSADGVYVPNDASQGNRINANSIYSNGDLGIDLGQNGVTPNDSDDPDSGPNLLQNYPTLASVGSNGSATKFSGALNSKPNQTYRVRVLRRRRLRSFWLRRGPRLPRRHKRDDQRRRRLRHQSHLARRHRCRHGRRARRPQTRLATRRNSASAETSSFRASQSRRTCPQSSGNSFALPRGSRAPARLPRGDILYLTINSRCGSPRYSTAPSSVTNTSSSSPMYP